MSTAMGVSALWVVSADRSELVVCLEVLDGDVARARACDEATLCCRVAGREVTVDVEEPTTTKVIVGGDSVVVVCG